MWVQLREGSAWHDVEKLAPVLLEDGVDSRHALLVTDDMHPETLATVGHLNHAVRTAIAAGIDPLVAIQMATVNAAEYIGLPARHRLDRPGPLRGHPARGGPRADAPAPGAGRRRADRRETPDYEYPARARDTVRIARTPTVAGPAHRRDGRSRAGARDRHGPRRAGHRAPGRGGGGGRRRGAARIRRSTSPRPRASSATAGRARSASASCRASGWSAARWRRTVAHDNHNLFVVGHGRRRHARRGRAPARDRRRDGGRRRRRGHRRGAAADRRA